ncbi:MAG: gamma-glutamyl-gamma-aminobutyrate hydrolase family protein, partial [Acidobacteriota bacterium]
VLSLMSDWNPAELIGAHPRPLALSLFEMLVARGIWWQARSELGYAAAPGPDVKLLHVLHGRPLVDVRRSANSLLPRGLSAATSREIVDDWIARLNEQPALHDKVEFAVYRTIRDFSAPEALQREWAASVTPRAWQEWKAALDMLSRSVTSVGLHSPLARQSTIIDALAREDSVGIRWTGLLAISQQGTRAFAALARIAFAAEAQLRSAVRRDALTAERAFALRAAGRSSPVRDWSDAGAADFVARHGHLRPGTFDITQETWAANAYQPRLNCIERPAPFFLSTTESANMQSLLRESGMLLCPDAWVQFVQQSASARERGKFVFSRYLSAAMDGIAEMCALSGLDRDGASWLTVEQLLQGQVLGASERAAYWRRRAHDAQRQHDAEAMLILSPILRGNADRTVADSMGILPNFVGQRIAEGPIVVLSDTHARPYSALHKAIVVTSRADPGFDWLFQSGIAGLITAWGGSNSHLAIRCVRPGRAEGPHPGPRRGCYRLWRGGICQGSARAACQNRPHHRCPVVDLNASSPTCLRIGITQRRLPAGTASNERDALDAAWNDWFADHWPAASFLAIPNFSQPERAQRYIHCWGLNGLILAGGEDVGSSPVRDAMEMGLLDHARVSHLPILGICRGMQALHAHSGGTLVKQAGHVGKPHAVVGDRQSMMVNSWHSFAITSLQPGWRALAVANDGSIEAMQHVSLPWLGLMWHPERPAGDPEPMKRWIADLFSSALAQLRS